MGRKSRSQNDAIGREGVDPLPEVGAPEPGTRTPAPEPAREVSEAATISVVEGEVDLEKRARKLESQKRYRDKARAKRLEDTPDNSRDQAALFVTIVSATAGSLVGPGASMLEHERELILDPLARIIARMPADARANMDQYIDPIALLFGLTVWGVRVYQSSANRPPSETTEQVGAPFPIPTPEPEPVARDSGQVVTQSPALARDLSRLVGGVA